MIKKGEKVKMIQGKVMFADPAKQKEFVKDLTKRYELGKRSTKAVAAGVLRNEDIYNKYFKGIYSPSSVRTVIDRFKKAMDLEYYKLSPQERDINKLNRIADEVITQGGKRLSATKTSPLHHLFPLGDEYVKARGKDFAILDDKTNAAMQSYNKDLKSLVIPLPSFPTASVIALSFLPNFLASSSLGILLFSFINDLNLFNLLLRLLL